MENLNSEGGHQPTHSDESSSQSFSSPLIDSKIHSQDVLITDPDQQEILQPCKNEEAFQEDSSSERIIETDEAEPEYRDILRTNNTDQVEGEEFKDTLRDEDQQVTSRSPNRIPKIQEEAPARSQNINSLNSSKSSSRDEEDNDDQNFQRDAVDHFAELFDASHNFQGAQNQVMDSSKKANLHEVSKLYCDEFTDSDPISRQQASINSLDITDCNNSIQAQLFANQIKTQEKEDYSVDEERDFEEYDGEEIIDIGDDIQPFSMNSIKNQESKNAIQTNIKDLDVRYPKIQNDYLGLPLQSAEKNQEIQSQESKLNDLSEFDKLFGLQLQVQNEQNINTDEFISEDAEESIVKDLTHNYENQDYPQIIDNNDENKLLKQTSDNQEDEFERSDDELIDERNDSDVFGNESEPMPLIEQDDYDPYANSMMFKSFKIKPGQFKTMKMDANQFNQNDPLQQEIINDEENEDQFDPRDEENLDGSNILQDDKQESKINVFLNNFAQMQNHQRKLEKGKRQGFNFDEEQFGQQKSTLVENDYYHQIEQENIQNDCQNQGDFQNLGEKTLNLGQEVNIDKLDGNGLSEEGMMNSFEVRLNNQDNNDSGLFNNSFSSQEQKNGNDQIKSNEGNLQPIKSSKNITKYEPRKKGEVSQEKVPQPINLFSFDNEVDINIVDDNSYDEEDEQNIRQDAQNEEMQILNQENQTSFDTQQIDGYERAKPQRPEVDFAREEKLSDEGYDQDSFEEEGQIGEQITSPQLQTLNLDKESNLEFERDQDERSEESDEEISEKSPVYDQAMFSRFSSTFKFNPGEFNSIKSGIEETSSLSKPQLQEIDIYNKRNEITYGSENPFGDVDRFDFEDFQPIQDDTFEEDDDESFNFKGKASPSKIKSYNQNMNQSIQKTLDPKNDLQQSVSIQNLAIVKGGMDQNIDIRKAVQVDKFLDANTQRQISISQRQEEDRAQDYIPEMITDSSVEIIKQTKHDQFYNFFEDKDNDQKSQDSIRNEAQNFFDFFGVSNEQDSSLPPDEKIENQNRYRLGRQIVTNQQDDIEDEDDEFDRDEEGSRDKDLDELFGFESQAKKKERERKLQEDQDDGMIKKSFNTLESGDWFTMQKLDGWKIIDSARPDHEQQEKSRAEDLHHANLNFKPHQSKRIALIMEGIFQNMIRNQNKNLKTQIQPPKKKGKQPMKAHFRSQSIEIQFGKIFASGILTIINESTTLLENSAAIFKIGLRRLKRSLADKEKAQSLAMVKIKQIILPKFGSIIFDYTESKNSCEQHEGYFEAEIYFSLKFFELRLESDDQSQYNYDGSITYKQEIFIKIQTKEEVIRVQSTEQQQLLQLSKYQRPVSQVQYEDFFKLKPLSIAKQHSEKMEAQEKILIEDNNDLSHFQETSNQFMEDIMTPIKSQQQVKDRNLLSEDRTTTTQNEDYMPFDVSLDQIYGSPPHPMQMAKQSSSVNRSMSSQSSSQQSFMNPAQINQTANRKLKISRKSIQFINQLAQKEGKDKREPKNQDEGPQHQIKHESSSLSSQQQHQLSIPSSQVILRDASMKEDKLSNQKQMVGGQKQQQFLKFSKQDDPDKLHLRENSQSISNSKVHENLQRVLQIKPNIIQGVSHQTAQKQTTPQKIILKTVTKSIQNRISDIHQVDTKMLQIRKNVRALNLNAQSPSSPNLNKNQSQQSNPHFTIGQDPQVEQDFQGLKKILMTNTRHKVDIFKSEDPNTLKDSKPQHQRTSQSFNKIKNILQTKGNTSITNQSENQVNLSLISQVASKFEKIKPLRLQSKGKVTSNQTASVFSRLSQGLSSQQRPLIIQDFEEQKVEDTRNSEPLQRLGIETSKILSEVESKHKVKISRQIASKSDYEVSKEEESLDEIRLNESNIPLLYGSHQSSLHSQSVPEYGVPTQGLEYKHTFLSNQGSNSIPEIRTFSEGSGSPQSVNRPLKIRGNEFKKEDILKILKDKSPTKPQMLNNFISQDEQQ